MIIEAFLVITSGLEKKPWDVVGKENRKKALSIYKAEWMIWPPEIDSYSKQRHINTCVYMSLFKVNVTRFHFRFGSILFNIIK